MATSDSIWISLLFEQRPPCIIDPAVYRSGCTYGMNLSQSLKLLVCYAGTVGALGIELGLWKLSTGFGDALPFCSQKRLLSTEAGKQPGEALVTTTFLLLTVGKKAAFASFFELTRYLKFSCDPLTDRKHKLPSLLKTIA